MALNGRHLLGFIWKILAHGSELDRPANTACLCSFKVSGEPVETVGSAVSATYSVCQTSHLCLVASVQIFYKDFRQQTLNTSLLADLVCGSADPNSPKTPDMAESLSANETAALRLRGCTTTPSKGRECRGRAEPQPQELPRGKVMLNLEVATPPPNSAPAAFSCLACIETPQCGSQKRAIRTLLCASVLGVIPSCCPDAGQSGPLPAHLTMLKRTHCAQQPSQGCSTTSMPSSYSFPTPSAGESPDVEKLAPEHPLCAGAQIQLKLILGQCWECSSLACLQGIL